MSYEAASAPWLDTSPGRPVLECVRARRCSRFGPAKRGTVKRGDRELATCVSGVSHRDCVRKAPRVNSEISSAVGERLGMEMVARDVDETGHEVNAAVRNGSALGVTGT
jgi:hypothetical protein